LKNGLKDALEYLKYYTQGPKMWTSDMYENSMNGVWLEHAKGWLKHAKRHKWTSSLVAWLEDLLAKKSMNQLKKWTTAKWVGAATQWEIDLKSLWEDWLTEHGAADAHGEEDLKLDAHSDFWWGLIEEAMHDAHEMTATQWHAKVQSWIAKGKEETWNQEFMKILYTMAAKDDATAADFVEWAEKHYKALKPHGWVEGHWVKVDGIREWVGGHWDDETVHDNESHLLVHKKRKETYGKVHWWNQGTGNDRLLQSGKPQLQDD